MNTSAIEKRLGRPLTDFETAAIEALTPLIQALGVRETGLGWIRDPERSCIAHARWYGYALLPGKRLFTSDRFDGPAAAAEALGAEMLRHLLCPYCDRPIATGLATGCPWRLFHNHWRPGCRSNAPLNVQPYLAPAGKDEPS